MLDAQPHAHQRTENTVPVGHPELRAQQPATVGEYSPRYRDGTLHTPNGLSSNRTVQFGGQRFTPERNLENQIQLANTVYWNKGRYNFTFGTDNTLTYLDTYISNEQNGRFIFNNLREFDNLNPSRYAREVPTNGFHRYSNMC